MGYSISKSLLSTSNYSINDNENSELHFDD